MSTVADINARRMRMDYLQTRVLRLQSPGPFFLLLPVLPQRLRCPHPFLLNKQFRIRFGPVTKGLENLPNGGKEPSHRRRLPPCQRSPFPEPSSPSGTKHQWPYGLSLPSPILDPDSQRIGNSAKFLPPATCVAEAGRCSPEARQRTSDSPASSIDPLALHT